MYVLPETIDRAEEIRAVAETRIAPGMLIEGVANTITPQITMSFQRWLSPDVIGEVVLTQDRKPGDFTFIAAEQGYFVEKDGTYVLVLQNGSQLIHKSADDVHQVSFTELSIPLTAPERNVAPGNGFYDQPIWKLLNPPEEARQNPQSLAVWLSEGHHRIINPLRCTSCALLLLGVLVPGLQGYAELIIRLLVAVGLSFAENSASTVAFVLAQRHAEICPLLYLLPLTSGGIGAALLCLGDRHHPRWLRTPKLWRAKPRSAEADGYGPGVTFASRASLE
jgi:lipopolysaccharide export system permease protein